MGAVVLASSPSTGTGAGTGVESAPSGLVVGQTLTGWDGSVWDLMNPSGGVFLLQEPIVGLGETTGARWSSVAPYVPGSRYRGTQVLERPVSFSVGVVADSFGAWVVLDRAFRRILRRDKTLVWTVTLEGVGVFNLTCRYDGPALPFDGLLAAQGYARYDLSLVADEHPYWRGEPVTATFTTATPEDFIPSGGAPPFIISEGSTMGSASITNRGDVTVWPTWTFRDAFTAISATVGGSTIGVVPDLVSGDVLVVDTNPRVQSAVLNGTRVRGIISPHAFAPIPAGDTTPITFAWTGSGSASVTIIPELEFLL